MAASEETEKPTLQQEVEANDCKPSTSGANEDELERIATEELLREAKRGAERVREMGIFGWQKSPVPPVNKRFLNNTLSSTLRHPFKKKPGPSRSPRENSNDQRPNFPDWGDDRRRRTRYVDKNDLGDGDHRHGPGPVRTPNVPLQSKDVENIKPENKQNSWDSPEMNVRKRTRSRSPSVNGKRTRSRSPSVNGKLRKKSKSDKKRSKSSNHTHSRTRSKNKSDKSRSKKHKSSSRKKDKDKDKDKDKSKKSKSKHKHESKHNGKHEKKKHGHKSKHKKDKKHKK